MPASVAARADVVTVRQAARLIGVHENTLRKWTERGIISAVHLPGSGFRRIPAAEIDRVRAEMWRDVAESGHPGMVPADVPKGVFAEDGFDEDLP
jgi:excisionase family DNA binding protein